VTRDSAAGSPAGNGISILANNRGQGGRLGTRVGLCHGAAMDLDAVPAGLPTVTEVLQLPSVQQGRPTVAAGRAGLGRPVRWTHVAEVPDIARLLRGGELLLSTGVAFPDDPDELSALVDQLARADAAGLLVELGRRYPSSLPVPLVKAAERHGLPLVALHRETPFVAVTEAVHARIVEAQVAQLRVSDQLHQTFTQLSIEGAGVAEVVRQTARLASAPVVLENLAHQVLAFDTAGRQPDVLLDRWESRSRRVTADDRTALDPGSGWLVTRVGARGTDWGRLVVVLDGPPRTTDVMLVERSAAALALHRLLERDREGLERQTHRTLLTGLLRHDVSTAEIAISSRALGVPLDGRRLVGLVLRPRAVASSGPLEKQEGLARLSDDAAAALRTLRLTGLAATIDDATVGVLLSVARAKSVEGSVTDLAAAVRRQSSDRGVVGAEADVLIAVGSAVDDLADVRRSFLEAAQVADAAALQPTRPFYRLPDVRLRGLLQLLSDDARVQMFVERELGPLLRHDADQDTELLGVLRAYLEQGRNKSAAAGVAHLSRPSFYDRLGQVEAVLAVDLDSVESCLSLHVALLALDAFRSAAR
jgi:PucR family transcriptional regulator, purine catabolism regulatory protein